MPIYLYKVLSKPYHINDTGHAKPYFLFKAVQIYK